MTPAKPFGAGCEADHLALIEALSRYETAERIATLLGRDVERMADRAHEDLTRLAVLCGHEFASRTDSVLSFSRRRVECFSKMTASRSQPSGVAPSELTDPHSQHFNGKGA